jgi:RNA polymerase sigma factor (sigma-70 family)
MKNGAINSDEALIEAIGNGDQRALKTVYQQHWDMVLGFVLNNSGSEDDAKDIYQEALIVVLQKARSGEFVLTSKLKTFIYSVCRRMWLKQLHLNSRFTDKVNDNESYEEFDADLDAHEKKTRMQHIVQASMNELGEPCKTIITDFFYGGLTMEEIAEKMGYTNAANAKNQKYKCFKRFKKLVIDRNKTGS